VVAGDALRGGVQARFRAFGRIYSQEGRDQCVRCSFLPAPGANREMINCDLDLALGARWVRVLAGSVREETWTLNQDSAEPRS
jgi:hypothetical protein